MEFWKNRIAYRNWCLTEGPGRNEADTQIRCHQEGKQLPEVVITTCNANRVQAANGQIRGGDFVVAAGQAQVQTLYVRNMGQIINDMNSIKAHVSEKSAKRPKSSAKFKYHVTIKKRPIRRPFVSQDVIRMLNQSRTCSEITRKVFWIPHLGFSG